MTNHSSYIKFTTERVDTLTEDVFMSENNNSILRHFPAPFRVRQDNALTLPKDVMAMLEWSIGDSCWFTVDIKNRRLIVSPKPPQVETNTPGINH